MNVGINNVEIEPATYQIGVSSQELRNTIDIVKPASTLIEFYVSLTKSGDDRNVDDVLTLVQQIYTILMV